MRDRHIDWNDFVIRSMTGYGRHEATIDGRHITFEIKAVNHKYFEFSARITRGYLFLEEKLKSYVKNRVSRGKIDVFLQIETLEEEDVEVLVNHSLASGYMKALEEINDRYNLSEEIALSTLTRYSDILTVHKKPENEDKILKAVLEVADVAVDSFISMREAEGERLKDDIISRASTIISIVDEIEKISPNTIADYQERLKQKIVELTDNNHFDEQRVLTEVAIFADKVAVDEETVRLRSHFSQLETLMTSDEPVGRKIDFLVQEMNREANTIGSKSVNSEIAYLIVDIKAEIEKIREQIQNIE